MQILTFIFCKIKKKKSNINDKILVAFKLNPEKKKLKWDLNALLKFKLDLNALHRLLKK